MSSDVFKFDQVKLDPIVHFCYVCFKGKIRVDGDDQLFELWNNTTVLAGDSDIWNYVTVSNEEHSYSLIAVKVEAGAI